MFDVKQYNGIKFHQDESVNRKIEALFLLYDKKVYDNRLNYLSKIKLINVFIEDLIRFEEYEVVLAFKDKKFNLYFDWRRERRNKLKLKFRILLSYKYFKFRLKSKLRSFF